MTAPHFDAIIVGSGFGGSVMAYRLAEAGLQVCLLERGRAYPPDSFPHSPYKLRESFWNPKGGFHGLYDFWSFHRIQALVASGLGGGSLIYANVLLRKDERWFVKEAEDGYENWPVTRANLEPHYDRVEQMLRPQPYPFDHAPYNATPKTQAFREAAQKIGMEPFFPNLAVTFANEGDAPVPGEPIREAFANLHGRTRQTCRLCGECDLGCNYGSKNTFDYTYLSEAKRRGAAVRTGCEVKSFQPLAGGGYSVRYLEHSTQADLEEGSELRTMTADKLVLTAGTLGSTYLLLKNRSAFPRLSSTLGTRFCGNGDYLSFAIKASREVDGERVPRVIDPGYGPVITSAVRGGDTLDGGDGRGFYLEDAGFPQHVT